MSHPGYLRNYESTLRLLGSRGHRVHVAFRSVADRRGGSLLEEVARTIPDLSYDTYPARSGSWSYVARGIRALLDAVRYLDRRLSGARLFRERVQNRLPAPFGLIRNIRALPDFVVTGVTSFLLMLEQCVPVPASFVAYMEERQPDVVLVTPLVNLASEQVDIVKCSQALGIPCGLCVASWDNLTTKGLIRIQPDRVFVWNEFQKREAIELHGTSADSIVVTGAPRFDEWFERGPSRSREEFCRTVGLPPEHPIILFVGSSAFLVPSQAELMFIDRWIREIRAATKPNVSGASVLIRPHPLNSEAWRTADLTHLKRVAVWPRRGADPTDKASKDDFFDSLFHSAAVVGINTTAQIEAGIVGRPVLTVTAPEFRAAQDETLHFRHLGLSGLVSMSVTLADHVVDLARYLADPSYRAHERQQSVQDFVRPRGSSPPATDLLVSAIEDLGNMRVGRRTLPSFLWPFKGLLALLATALAGARWLRSGTRMRTVLVATIWRIAWLPRRFARWIANHFIWPIVERTLLGRPPAMSHGGRGGTSRSASRDAAARLRTDVTTELENITASGRTIIAGPWMSEVGFEVLYWLPFLRWVTETYRIDRDRLIVVSRGGADLWYRTLTSRYVDLFDVIKPQEFRERNSFRSAIQGVQKQMAVTRSERELIDRVRRIGGYSDAALLHPALMNRMFKPFWRRRRARPFPEVFSRFSPWEVTVDDELRRALPSEYVTARFYYNESFPQTQRNAEFVSRLVNTLSNDVDVVLLTSGIRADEHIDVLPPATARVHRIDHLLTARNNLGVQTRIIAGARAAFSTYGGFSYIPPFCGVPSVSFFSQRSRFLPIHLEVALRTFDAVRDGSFLALDVEDELASLRRALRYARSEGSSEQRLPAKRSTEPSEDRIDSGAPTSPLIVARDRRIR